MKKIKKLIKRFVSYTIEDDIRIYRLKHTPVKVTWPLTRRFLAKYGALPVKPDKIVIDNYMGQGYGCNPKYVAEALAEPVRAGLDCKRRRPAPGRVPCGGAPGGISF